MPVHLLVTLFPSFATTLWQLLEFLYLHIGSSHVRIALESPGDLDMPV